MDQHCAEAIKSDKHGIRDTTTMFGGREEGWRLRGVARAQEDDHSRRPGAEGNVNAARAHTNTG